MTYLEIFISFRLLFIIDIAAGSLTNSTGGTFPASIYAQSTFAYRFETSPENTVIYSPLGSGTGKCNIMGYWQTGNLGTVPVSSAVIARDTAICTDKCVGAAGISLCGNDSSKYPRFDRKYRVPLADFTGSDSLLGAADYKAFPDLHMFPSVAGAAVPIYNIPELANITSPVILSRGTMAAIFRGSIKRWNDPRIINDNTGIVRQVLQSLNQTVKIVVRTDSSGTSEIFSTGLSSFDPPSSSKPDYSFASLVGSGQTPKWCGPLTDEIQILTVSGCYSWLSAQDSRISLEVVGLDFALHNISFQCDATSSVVKAAFESVYGSGTMTVSRSSSTVSSFVFSIGYWYSPLSQSNRYEPSVFSAGLTNVSITTLQEGGYLNSHYNSSYVVTVETQSLWVNKMYNAKFSLSYPYPYPYPSTGMSAVVDPSQGSVASAIKSAILGVSPGLVTSVKAVTHGSSVWTEYQISFNTSKPNSLTPGLLTVHTVSTLMSGQVVVTRLLRGANYPLFYDNRHSAGLANSGRYTCYRNEDKMSPWSYYTGNGNPGVVAQVCSR